MTVFSKARLFRSLSCFLSCLAAIVALELGVRLCGGPEYHRPRLDVFLPDTSGNTAYVAHGVVPNATIRSRYDGDPRNYFQPGNVIDHTFNSVGWRDVEHSTEKTPGTYRILGLGDSYLFGQGVRPADICLIQTARLLEQSCGGRVEPINTGQSGYNTTAECDLLEAEGLSYHPDLVILYFVPNDVEPSLEPHGPKVEFFANYTGIYEQPDGLSHWSRLWGLVRQRYLLNVRAREYVAECARSFDPEGEKWSQCRSALDRIRDLCRKEDVPLLVVIFPFFHQLNGRYPFQAIHDLVRSWCESVDAPFVDLRDSFRAYEGRELWVHPSDPHPNEEAHRIAAKVVFERLCSKPAAFRLPCRRVRDTQ